MRSNPRDWRIADVVAVCDAFGLTCTAPRKGSHYKIRHASQAEILTIPARRPIKPVYIADLVRSSIASREHEMRPQDYEVTIRPLSADEGGGFLAAVPELPGCRSDGESPQQALENVYDAILCWIEAAEEMGREVPSPRRADA